MDGNSNNYLISDATRRGEATAYQLSAKSKVRLAIEADLAAGGSRAVVVCRNEWDRIHGRFPTNLAEADFPGWQEHWLAAFRERMATPLSAADRRARDGAEREFQKKLDRAVFLGEVDD